MSIAAVQWALAVRGLKATHKLVLVALGERHNKDSNLCSPDQVMLARDVDMGERTVRRILCQLEEQGLITRRVTSKGRGRMTQFTLHMSRRRPVAPPNSGPSTEVKATQDVGTNRPDWPLGTNRPDWPVGGGPTGQNGRLVEGDQPATVGRFIRNRNLEEVDRPRDILPTESDSSVSEKTGPAAIIDPPALDLGPQPQPAPEARPSATKAGKAARPAVSDEHRAAFEAAWALWPAKGRERSSRKPLCEAQFARAASAHGLARVEAAVRAFVRKTEAAYVPGFDRWFRSGKFEHFLPAKAPDPACDLFSARPSPQRSKPDWRAIGRRWAQSGILPPGMNVHPDEPDFEGPIALLEGAIECSPPPGVHAAADRVRANLDRLRAKAQA